ncbi:MAG TPA: glycosyltransferase family A protein [Phycisphaerae bacterium]|nr:glycosyltransferase family A protein [Phycisphaerae bacterium]
MGRSKPRQAGEQVTFEGAMESLPLAEGDVQPTVSVVIPAYNVAATLARAVRSVTGQTSRPLEVFVVDDGSTDGTADVGRGFGPPVRYIRQDNGGAGAARNRGVTEARGEWVAFLDADDWWEPEHLARQFDVVRRHPELVWVAGRCVNVWPGGAKTVGLPSEGCRKLLEDGCWCRDYYEAAAAGVQFPTIVMLIRRRVFDEVGLFDAQIRSGQDRDMWFRIADRFPAIGYVDEPIAVYDRTAAGSLTRSNRPRGADDWRLLTKHVPQRSQRPNGPETPRDRHFRSIIARSLRNAARFGDQQHLARVLAAYGDRLGTAQRVVWGLVSHLPSGVVRLAAKGYGATVVPLRVRRRK